MSALKSLKDMFRFKAPDIEQSVMDMMHNPTPRSSMFPYLFFDRKSGLYHMQGGVLGFVLEASPIVGCGSSTYKQISMLFDDVLPEGSVLEVLLLASDNLDIPLEAWKHGRVSQNKRLKIVLQAVACGLLIAILFFSGHLHGRSSAKAYVYVDVEKVMRAIVSSLDASDLSADELNAQIDSHRQKFQELLSDYSASDNVMIIAKPKVISGAPDKTDFFIEKLLGGHA